MFDDVPMNSYWAKRGAEEYDYFFGSKLYLDLMCSTAQFRLYLLGHVIYSV
jgi:hypothetical protein